MKLTIFNGSPRGKKSNTSALINPFVQGFTKNNDHTVEISYLVQTARVAEQVALFGDAERVLIAFPLYTDAMPGIVKYFIDALEPLCHREKNTQLAFMVHSGFPEAIHSRFVERYLEKLTARLGCDYTGTIVKPGSEGVRLMPPLMNKRLFELLRSLGSFYAETDTFDPGLLKKMAPRETRSESNVRGYRAMDKLGLVNMYWDQMLKKNGVFEKRFDRPFA